MTDRRRLGLVLCLAPTAAAMLAASPGVLAGADDWAQCGPGYVLPARPAVERDPGDPDAAYINADEVDATEGGITILTGDVDVARGPEQIRADKVTYDEPGQIIDAEGDVKYWNDEGIYVTGTRGRAELQVDRTVMENANYLVIEAHARGDAQRVELTGRDLMNVRNATYTTCNPGSADWILVAKEIRLDKSTNIGSARNVWVKFKNVPIFYSPFLTFPLSDERKSGFLVPSAGVSGTRGVEATIPYYFNIAPNYDATLALRPMSNRGVQMQAEGRYLQRWGEGLLGVEYLPNDSEIDDDRAALHFQHLGTFAQRWTANVDVNWVSDSDYFEDLGTELAVTSRTFLERRGDLTYAGDGWWGLARVQDYQTLDDTLAPASRPHERLPQLYAATSLRERNRRINLGATAEFVSFDRDASVTGNRVDLRPFVTYPVRTAGTFFVPRAVLRYTQYDLDNVAAGADDSPSRLIPTFSLDGGAFLERPFRFADRALIQTLEPRAYYLFTPFDGQDDQPVFDTGQYTFSFAQLFRDDRFAGADRVGDANQLTLALTSRFLRPDGDELFRASIGQIRHFSDRKVTLPGAARDTTNASDLVAEVAANLAQRWRVLGAVLWNSNDDITNRSTVSLRYQPDPRRVLNLSYRFVRDVAEQTDFSFAWPIARNWRAVGRFNYALDLETDLETFAGIEYESCCWGLRLVGRRYLSNTEGEHTNAIFLQLELKGLTGVGGASAFLERNIPGYRNEF